MRWDDITSHQPRQISAEDRSAYYDDGFLFFPELLTTDTLVSLNHALSLLIEHSRSLTASTPEFDLEPGHTSDSPRLRRAANVDDADPVFWDFCSNSVLVDIAADILGPNVRFRDAFANLKWAHGGAAVGWHQDLAFYPHTNSGTCQFIVALDEVIHEKGPLVVVPGSHRHGMFSHYDDEGEWAGRISSSRLANGELDGARELTGPAGTVSVHHSLMLHYSAPNNSDSSRPVLVVTYAAADALPYTAAPYRSSHHGELVCGEEPGVAHHEEMMLSLPPDWSNGYTSIFAHQEKTDGPTI